MANNHISIASTAAARYVEWRALVNQGIAFRNAVAQLSRSLSQYGGDSAGFAAIESDFGFTPGGGAVVAGLLPSAETELTGGIADATFVAQVLDRGG